MAYAPPRSANKDLHEGMTDGCYKKVITDRGGFPEPCTAQMREDLSDIWYGIHEDRMKHLPDGRAEETPDWLPTREAQISV